MPQNILPSVTFPTFLTNDDLGVSFEVTQGMAFWADRAFIVSRVYLLFQGNWLKSALNWLTRKPIAEIIEDDLVRIFDSDWEGVLRDLATKYESIYGDDLTIDLRYVQK